MGLNKSEFSQHTVLADLEQQGFVDGVGGGPLCGTCSTLRLLPDGPSPLRSRGMCARGLPKRSKTQAEQVWIANM